MPQGPITYKQAGVDIDAASSLKKKIAPLVRATFSPEVLQDIGLFGGMFKFDTSRFDEPILVSSVDGVGTKLKIAFATGRNNTIGIDLVSHCVNDILMQGAQPLFFLDYLAMGKLDVSAAEQVIAGLAEGCSRIGCAAPCAFFTQRTICGSILSASVAARLARVSIRLRNTPCSASAGIAISSPQNVVTKATEIPSASC